MPTVASVEASGRDDDADGEFAPQPPDGAHETSLAPAAFYGPLGEIVRLIEPHSEADPAAVLVTLLVGFGNLVGPGPSYRVEGDRHPARLNAVMLGETSKGRKGTSAGRALAVLKEIDDYSWSDQIVGGLSSGEGLVYAVRDPLEGEEPLDRRLMVVESEFASVLRISERVGNTLTATIRNFWDHGNGGSLVKNNRVRATGAHVSILGHVTRDELLRYLSATEMASGFANRFLWICVRRSKVLPFGGDPDPIAFRPAIETLRRNVSEARRIDRVRFDQGAADQWREIYPDLSAGRPGMIGAMLGRAEAQVVRLALTYALADGSNLISTDHLRAGLAVWALAEKSVCAVFAHRTGDPLADRIGELLRGAPGGEMTRTELRQATGRNYDALRMDLAIDALKRLSLVEESTRPTAGRTADVYTWTGPS